MDAPTPIRWPKPAVPAVRKRVTAAVVEGALQSSKLSHLRPTFTDAEYVACTADEWARIFEQINTKALQYTPELHDCDDFGALARGLVPALALVNGIGWALDYSAQHSYNVVLVLDDADGSVSVQAMEPQTDLIVQGGTGHYTASSGMVIF